MTAHFLEKSIHSLYRSIDKANSADRTGRDGGLLQALRPEVKLAVWLIAIIAAIAAHSLLFIAGLLGLGVLLGVASRIPLSLLVSFVWLPVLGFAGLLAVPAIFLTPGRELLRLPILNWTVTQQGLTSFGYLILRSETTATCTMLLVFSTPLPKLLRALHNLRVPRVVVTLVAMTYRYIFLLLRLSLEMFQSRRSRLVTNLTGSERRKLISSTAGVLVTKSYALSQDVYDAMRSRGYRA
ncbi:MAG TPA: cobalt ECF transporter T component CbiQ [Bryobacteraceae bacterium]|jgi:cobalt ECF transporter T component CbiQ|nr:cobalt ECF transporter T component CbiQ [Bryobacteraceae bacterium]